MNRQLINEELARFSITENEYISLFVDVLREMPIEDAKKVGSFEISFPRGYIVMENQPDLEEGVILRPEIHTDILKITEQDEFLEKMKELAFGKFYSRSRYRM